MAVAISDQPWPFLATFDAFMVAVRPSAADKSENRQQNFRHVREKRKYPKLGKKLS